MWTWPTWPQLVDLTSKLGRLLAEKAVKWVLGAKLVRLEVTGAQGVDATIWVAESDGEALISVVNPAHEPVDGGLTLLLPEKVTVTGSPAVLWGKSGWSVGGEPGQLIAKGMSALAVDILTVKVGVGAQRVAPASTVATS